MPEPSEFYFACKEKENKQKYPKIFVFSCNIFLVKFPYSVVRSLP